MTTSDAVMDELRAAGSAQTVKTYRRHGVTGETFGVSYATLGALQKRIKTDHDLATALWASGNHDARVLATMVADPRRLSPDDLESWLAPVDNGGLLSAVVKLASRLKPAPWAAVERWTASPREWTAAAGWDLLALLALLPPDKGDPDAAHGDAYFRERLDEIERRIHGSPNQTRYSMNGAVIAIGSRDPALAGAATAAAGRIGPVHVDHGETACQTPAAAAYIERVWARKRKAA